MGGFMKQQIKHEKILIGKTLQKTRKALGFTQESVADALGLSPRYISDIERDKTKGSLDTLVKLCNIYHVSPSYILKDYINSPEYITANTISGFHLLEDEEKDIIMHLIQYMNEKKH